MKAALIVLTVALIGAAVAIGFAICRNKSASDKLQQDSQAVASASKNMATDIVSASAQTAREIGTNASIMATNVAAKVKVATSNLVDSASRVATNVVGEAKSKF
jgi:hypothetical protein